MNMISKYNINKKIYKKECTCGKGDHEYEITRLMDRRDFIKFALLSVNMK